MKHATIMPRGAAAAAHTGDAGAAGTAPGDAEVARLFVLMRRARCV
jgi:hypothetical protein